MFIDAGSAAREIARILKPGGRFVATAAESLAEPFMPTIVSDYRPIFEAAGFRTEYHQPIEGRDAAQLRFCQARSGSAPTAYGSKSAMRPRSS